MAATLRHSGKDAAVKLAGAAFNKFVSAEFRPRYKFADGSAGGDGMDVNIPIRAGYEFVASFKLADAEPFVALFSSVGASIAWILLMNSVHANGIVSGTGYLSEHPLRLNMDDPTLLDVTIIPDGSAVTVDLSPTA